MNVSVWRQRLALALWPDRAGPSAVPASRTVVEEVPAPTGLLYARGFLLCRSAAPASVSGWDEHQVGDWRLFVDSRVPLQRAVAGGRSVWLAGDAFDPENGIYEDIASHLASGEILDTLDRLAGRFLLLVQEGDALAVYHDAMGARSIYYGDGVVASHASLAAEMTGAQLRDWVLPFITSRGYLMRDVKYLPGLDTAYAGIRQLTPNTRLLLPAGDIERYWPRGPKPVVDREQAVGLLAMHLAALGSYARHHAFATTVGLSAGRDSRGVLAGLKQENPRVFTFVRSKGAKSSDSPDSRAARELAKRCGLDLEIVRVAAPGSLNDSVSPFASTFRRNTGYARGSNSSWIAHFARQELPDLLFVRGFGGEVMRGFYPPIDEISPAALAHVYDVNAGSRLARDPFRTFIDVAGWSRSDFYDYDLADLFYWEHRMGTWGASALAESDMVFRSIAGYNSRNLFASFMSLPTELRRGSELFDEATVRLAPELAGIPYES